MNLENNRKIRLLTLALFIFLSFYSCTKKTANQNKQPNVVFIMCDDLNDYEGAFSGHPQVKTPNIDKLAKSAVSFTNAHSNCPVCSPSRNSLFTGVYPFHSKDFGWKAHYKNSILKNNKTLFEYFSENGYHTMGSGKLLHWNKRKFWNEWGVEINNYGPLAFNGEKPVGHPSVPKPFGDIGPIDGSFAPLSDVPTFPDSISKGKKTGWLYTRNKSDFLDYTDENHRDLMPDEMHAEWATKRIKEMEAEGSDKPFFMGVGFVRPHTPLYAPKRFFDMFPIDEIVLSKIKENDSDDTHYRKNVSTAENKGWRYYSALKASYGGDAELGLKHFLQAYLACIAFTDEQIGKVVDAVNNSKFKNNTIIVLVSDHGWQMGEKDYLFKNSPWEESTRIPYIIKTPNGKAGVKVNHPVSLIDIFPTLKELCNLTGDNRFNEKGGTLDGHSLKPFLDNPETQKWDGPNGAISMIGVGLNSTDVMKQTYSYRTKNWRYILYMNGTEELYNEKTDPFEWENLANNKTYFPEKEMLKKEMLEIINKHK